MDGTTIAAHLEELERSLLRPETRRDAVRVNRLLADDFREVGASGRAYDKPGILALLSAEGTQTIEAGDFRCTLLSGEAALLTYRTQNLEMCTSAFRSSLWSHRDGRWQLLFHQGTPAA